MSKWNGLAAYYGLSRHQRTYLTICISSQLMKCHSLFLWYRSACFTIKKSGMRSRSSYFKSWQQSLQMEKVNICWKGIKTNFHGHDVPHDLYYNTTVVLKINFVYKQKNIDAKSQLCSMLSYLDNAGYFGK